jgi:hypothetical protein
MVWATTECGLHLLDCAGQRLFERLGKWRILVRYAVCCGVTGWTQDDEIVGRLTA